MEMKIVMRMEMEMESVALVVGPLCKYLNEGAVGILI